MLKNVHVQCFYKKRGWSITGKPDPIFCYALHGVWKFRMWHDDVINWNTARIQAYIEYATSRAQMCDTSNMHIFDQSLVPFLNYAQ